MGIAVDQAAGTCGIVMEAMEASLLDVITDGDFLAHVGWSGALLAIAADVAMGMEYIHKNGVLHRDLKPANVLIDATWNAKIADFGTMTRVADDIPEVERLAGTPPYMAPESIAKAAYNTSTDVWGFGCVLSHMDRAPRRTRRSACKTTRSLAVIGRSTHRSTRCRRRRAGAGEGAR